MYKILCYGDSNTWGFDTKTFHEKNTICRFKTRWTDALQENLGKQYDVCVDALNGRTTNFDDPDWPNRNAKTDLPLTLEKHTPIDAIILILGTNDLKFKFKKSPEEVIQGLAELIKIIRYSSQGDYAQYKTPKIILATPTIIKKEIAFDNEFKNARKKSQKLVELCPKLANEEEVTSIDANQAKLDLETDGIHFSKVDHIKFSKFIAEKIQKILFHMT